MLEDALSLQSTWRGRRCKEVRLPIDWPGEGVYEVCTTTTGKLAIKIRTTGATKLVPESRMPAGSWSASALRIDYNWSETRAALAFESSIVSGVYKLVELFPDTTDHILRVFLDDFAAGQFQTQAQRRALEDAAASSRIPTPRKPPSGALVDQVSASIADIASGGARSASSRAPASEHIGSAQASAPVGSPESGRVEAAALEDAARDEDDDSDGDDGIIGDADGSGSQLVDETDDVPPNPVSIT